MQCKLDLMRSRARGKGQVKIYGNVKAFAINASVFGFNRVVQECCIYRLHPENLNWTQIKREAWISSNFYGVSRAIQVSVYISVFISS